MRTRIFWGLLILLVFLLGSPVSGVGQDQAGAAPQAEKQAPPAEKPALPDPKAVLQQMCDFLKNQPQFSFKAEVTNDQVYQGGKKLQYGQEVQAFFRRPDNSNFPFIDNSYSVTHFVGFFHIMSRKKDSGTHRVT